MNKTLSAHQMYFLSALLFTLGFIASYVYGWFVPQPDYAEYYEFYDQAGLFIHVVDPLLWVLPIAGIVLFTVGLVTSKSK